MKELAARWIGSVDSRGGVHGMMPFAGDAMLVRRADTDRWLVMRCPCGCGDEVPVNLDPRAGPAWRLYKPGQKATLYPSVWRDSGCRSHYILHHGTIWLFTRTHDEWPLSAPDETTVHAVFSVLPNRFVHYASLAELSMLEPWDTYLACQVLCSRKLAQAGHGKHRDHYRRLPATSSTLS